MSQSNDSRIAVLEQIAKDLNLHMIDDHNQLVEIGERLTKIETALNSGLVDTLKAVAMQQSEMQVIQTKHASWFRVLGWVTTTLAAGLIALIVGMLV